MAADLDDRPSPIPSAGVLPAPPAGAGGD